MFLIEVLIFRYVYVLPLFLHVFDYQWSIGGSLFPPSVLLFCFLVGPQLSIASRVVQTVYSKLLSNTFPTLQNKGCIDKWKTDTDFKLKCVMTREVNAVPSTSSQAQCLIYRQLELLLPNPLVRQRTGWRGTEGYSMCRKELEMLI